MYRPCHQKTENRHHVYSTDVQSGGLQEKRNTGKLMSLMDNITTITVLSLGEVVHRSRDREGWRAVVASIGGATIEYSVVDD